MASSATDTLPSSSFANKTTRTNRTLRFATESLLKTRASQNKFVATSLTSPTILSSDFNHNTPTTTLPALSPVTSSNPSPTLPPPSLARQTLSAVAASSILPPRATSTTSRKTSEPANIPGATTTATTTAATTTAATTTTTTPTTPTTNTNTIASAIATVATAVVGDGSCGGGDGDGGGGGGGPDINSLSSDALVPNANSNQDRNTSSLVQTTLDVSQQQQQQQPQNSSSTNRVSSKLVYALRFRRKHSNEHASVSSKSVPPSPSQPPATDDPHIDVSTAPVHSRSLDGHHPRRRADLSFLTATTFLRAQRSADVSNPSVSYISQVDIDDFMTKRSKVGTSASVYVSLQDTVLSLAKGKTSQGRQEFDIRKTPVKVDVPARELRIFILVSGKNKILRLAMPSEQIAIKWKDAIQNALCSDIKEQYTFGKTIGSGAFGQVILAVHNISKEHRAIKVIQRGEASTKSREHLKSEIQVMKSISHPNIVHTHQIFDLKRTIYIVMEYVSGGDLFDFVAQHEFLTEKQSSETLRSIFRAVEYLHRNSVVHRDLKPENILCVNNTWPLQLKLTDFGFANCLDPCNEADDTMHTQVGTIYFMAPEIFANKGYGPAVDTWACGVLLYTILTGRLPFPGKNTTEYMRNVVTGKPLFPTILWRGISDDAKSLIKGLLNHDPNKRLTALGALQHRWVAWPDAAYGNNEIRRDRSNLHSDRRQLFKARSAVIAVAMANKFRATIPHMVDSLGDSTKKVAGAIENGVKKTADGIEKGLGEIASGAVRIGDGIGEGTRKIAGDIGGGTKKMAGGIAGGTKKVAEGIGHGVKKTKDGVENSARFVGEGVKKTAGGIEKGVKHTAGGIGHGVKSTGSRLKRSVELVVRERSKDNEVERTERNLLLADSSPSSSSKRMAHAFMLHSIRRKNAMSRSADSAHSQSLPLTVQHKRPVDDDGSSTDFVSALEEHSETEDGWGSVYAVADRSRKRPDLPISTPKESISPGVSKPTKMNIPTTLEMNGPPMARPELPPLSGVTMGWSDEAMLGAPLEDDTWRDRFEIKGFGGSKEMNLGIGLMPGGGADLLRRTTALLMAAKPNPSESETSRD